MISPIRLTLAPAALALLLGVGCQGDSAPVDTPRQEAQDDFILVRGSDPFFTTEEIDAVRERSHAESARRVTALRPELFLPREWTVKDTAADALARIGPASVPPLVATLSDQDPQIRQQGAAALARLGPAAEDAVPALIRALGDSDDRVRQAAARALGQIGPAAEPAIPALIDILREPDPLGDFPPST